MPWLGRRSSTTRPPGTGNRSGHGEAGGRRRGTMTLQQSCQGTPVRRLVKLLNRFFIVPAFRLGLGPAVGNPITGYYMVVRTVGRKTGRARYAPVTYAIIDGCVYCLAGYGRTAAWYLNAMAARDVQILLPGRTIDGQVEEVEDEIERLAVTRQIFRNAGLMGYTEGFDPFRAGDETVRAKTAAMPVLRIRQPEVAIAGSAFDPGGWVWLWWPLVLVAVVAIGATVLQMR
jgi:deazaflavin-dependent oxidoreductase (nitroreductase family)